MPKEPPKIFFPPDGWRRIDMILEELNGPRASFRKAEGQDARLERLKGLAADLSRVDWQWLKIEKRAVMGECYLSAVSQASDAGDIELALEIYRDLKKLPFSLFPDVFIKAADKILKDLAYCRRFEELLSTYGEYGEFTGKVMREEAFLQTGAELLSSLKDSGGGKLSGAVFAMMEKSRNRAARQLFLPRSVNRHMAAGAYEYLRVLKNNGERDEALALLKREDVFGPPECARHRYLSAFSLLGPFSGEGGHDGYLYLTSILSEKKKTPAEARILSEAALDFAREVLKEDDAVEAVGFYDFLRGPGLGNPRLFNPVVVKSAALIMDKLLEREMTEKAWKIFTELPRVGVRGAAYSSLYNAALIFLLNSAEEGKPKKGEEVYKIMYALAASEKEALDFARSMFAEMSVCLEDGLYDVVENFYESFHPERESPGFAELYLDMTLALLCAKCESDQIEDALEIYAGLTASLPMSEDDYPLPLAEAETRVLESLIEDGALEAAERIFFTRAGFFLKGRLSGEWVELAGELVRSLRRENKLSRMEKVYEKLRREIAKKNRHRAKLYKIAREALKGFLEHKLWGKALSLFAKLPDPAKSAKEAREAGHLGFFLAEGLSKAGRVKETLALYHAISAAGDSRGAAVSKAKTGAWIVADFAAKGHLREAREVYDSLSALKSVKEVDLYRGKAGIKLMRGLIKREKPEKALDLLKTIPRVCDPKLLKKSLRRAAAALSLLIAKKNDEKKARELKVFLKKNKL
ncbi:MAG: hypothetical protein LBR53_11565 [Deltaproteobacteria bacterium]|jgi:hypothetical protein|nr:hypothetical protein [Deltaproteobacteria bacterium]